MNETFDLGRVLPFLKSEDLSEQAKALDDSCEIIRAFVRIVIEQWIQSTERLIIWERLYRFGLCAVVPLRELLDHTEDTELRVLAATVLLTLGDHTGVPILLHAITEGGEHLHAAARFLAKGQVKEAGQPMINRLRMVDFTQKEEIISLLAALEKLAVPLPDDLSQRLFSRDSPREFHLYKRISPGGETYSNI